MKHKIIIIILAIMIPVSFAVGNVVGIQEAECTKTHVEDYKPVTAKSYDLIFYDGESMVEVITEHKYMHPLSNNTMLITDKKVDGDIAKEVLEVIGDQE